MDPLSVIRALWHHRLVSGIALGLTAAAAIWVYLFGPVTYESSASFALLNPRIPTTAEIEEQPALGELNSDNPYLRSPDNSLAAQVIITQLNSAGTAERLEQQGLSGEYLVARGDSGGQGLLIGITGFGPSAEVSLETTARLGELLAERLRQIQVVNGADDRYLYTSLQVDGSAEAKEQTSNRLRATLVVGVAGFVLLFAAVSIARALDQRASVRARAGADAAGRTSASAAAQASPPPSSPSPSPSPSPSSGSGPAPDAGDREATAIPAGVRPSRPRSTAVSPGALRSASRRSPDSGHLSPGRSGHPGRRE